MGAKLEGIFELGSKFKEKISADLYEVKYLSKKAFDIFQIKMNILMHVNSKYGQKYEYLKEFNNHFLLLIENLNQGDVIIFDFNDEYDDRERITCIWDEVEILRILPSTTCPSYEPIRKTFNFRENNEFIDSILDVLDDYAIIIKKWGDNIEVSSAFSQVLRFNKDIGNKIRAKTRKTLENYNLWSIKDWAWKPKTLWMKLNSDSIDVRNEISSTSFISNLKTVNLFDPQLNMCKIDFHSLIKVADEFSKIEIRYRLWVFSKKKEAHKLEKAKDFNFYVNSSTLTFVYKGEVITFKIYDKDCEIFETLKRYERKMKII